MNGILIVIGFLIGSIVMSIIINMYYIKKRNKELREYLEYYVDSVVNKKYK